MRSATGPGAASEPELTPEEEWTEDEWFAEQQFVRDRARIEADVLDRSLTESDRWNGIRFARQHGSHLRYVVPTGVWLQWTGMQGRWEPVSVEEVTVRAKQTARSILEEAAAKDDLSLVKWAVKSQSKGRLGAMLAMASGEEGILLRASRLDADPDLLNFPNGTLDLRTFAFRHHRREDHLTKVTAARYDPAAVSPAWERFLDACTEGRPELRPFLARLAGHTLVGRNTDEVWPFLLGGAGSGKTTFLEALGNALGDYGEAVHFNSLMSSNRSGSAPSSDMARLEGARFVRAGEPDPNRKLDASKVKGLTGNDPMVARFLYKNDVRFVPSFTLWAAANVPPGIDSTDEGLWRRLLHVPFENARPREEDRDPAVKRELTDAKVSGAAILAWAVAGCRDWRAHGLVVPASVRTKTDQLRTASDEATDFFDACCLFGAGLKAGGGELHNAHKRWAEEAGVQPLDGKAFALRLSARGLVRGKGREHRVWHGVALRS